MNKKEQQQKMFADIPFWEWAAGALGLVLLLSVVGFLLKEAITSDHSPPDITIHKKQVQTTQGGHHVVTLRVINHGGRTAASLIIEGELRDRQGNVVETSTMTLQYAPAGSEREAGLFFQHDPNQFELHLRPTGYEHP